MAYVEMEGSGGSSHAVGQGNAATRIFKGEWSTRLAFAASMLGQLHPDIPKCWAHSVSIEPLGRPGTGEPLTYDFAKVTVEYVTDFALAEHWPPALTKPDLRTATGLTIQIASGGEFMRFPAHYARWEDNTTGDPDDAIPSDDTQAGRLLVQTADIEVSWSYVNNPPISTWEALKSKINDATFLGAPAGTLIFLGYDLTPSADYDAIVDPASWNLKAKFQFRGVLVGATWYGWNHEYRGQDGWKRIMLFDGTTWNQRYADADFSDMFT